MVQKKRIPGVILMGDQDPMYIMLNPAPIKSILIHDHFLGKRYTLTVDNKSYEVIPQYLGVDVISQEPRSVTFSLWTGKEPKTPLTLEERFIQRPWEEQYLQSTRLEKDLAFVHNEMKTKFASLNKISMVDNPEIHKVYNINARRTATRATEKTT